MGRIKNEAIKKVSKQLMEKYPEDFKTDFEENKTVINKMELFNQKYIRNRVAGFISKRMKRKAN